MKTSFNTKKEINHNVRGDNEEDMEHISKQIINIRKSDIKYMYQKNDFDNNQVERVYDFVLKKENSHEEIIIIGEEEDYFGQVNDKNEPSGKGQMFYKNKEQEKIAVFKGNFKNGLRDGIGIFHYSKGLKVMGTWQNNCLLKDPDNKIPEMYICPVSQRLIRHPVAYNLDNKVVFVDKISLNSYVIKYGKCPFSGKKIEDKKVFMGSFHENIILKNMIDIFAKKNIITTFGDGLQVATQH